MSVRTCKKDKIAAQKEDDTIKIQAAEDTEPPLGATFFFLVPRRNPASERFWRGFFKTATGIPSTVIVLIKSMNGAAFLFLVTATDVDVMGAGTGCCTVGAVGAGGRVMRSVELGDDADSVAGVTTLCVSPKGLAMPSRYAFHSSSVNIRNRAMPVAQDLCSTSNSANELILLGLHSFASSQPSIVKWYMRVMCCSKF
jgi:hypothetical protein